MPSLLLCAPSAYTGGGVEEWLWSLARGLGGRGWKIQVALAEGRRHHAPARYLSRYPYADVCRMHAPLGLQEERFLAVTRVLREMKPDIVMPVQLADVLYAAAWLKRRRGRAAPRVATCLHGQFGDVLADLAVCGGDVDLAASVSRQGLGALDARCNLRAPVAVHIPAGVPAPVASRPHDRDVLHLGYVGRLEQSEKRIRDLPLLVAALQDCRGLQFHVAGSGPEEPFLREVLAAAAADGRVVFHGELSREELYRSVYPLLDGLLVFSAAEGGPLAAWEAMVHGAVPVVSDFAGRREEGVLRADENCLVFPVGDIAAAAAGVRRLLDPELRRALAAAARRLPTAYAEEEFADRWDRELRAMLERPARMGADPLPRMVSPGRLAVPFSAPMSYALRRAFGRTPVPPGPGEEWPHAYAGRPGRGGPGP